MIDYEKLKLFPTEIYRPLLNLFIPFFSDAAANLSAHLRAGVAEGEREWQPADGLRTQRSPDHRPALQVSSLWRLRGQQRDRILQVSA